MDAVFQRCISPDCAATCGVEETHFVCPRCGGPLDVAYDWSRLTPPKSLRDVQTKWSDRSNPLNLSGVWRFRELLPFAEPSQVMTIGEGQTILQRAASLAVFCSTTGLMRAVIFIGSGKISYGKLAQALDHGALTVQITGDFDDAMQRVQQVARKLGIYLVNSVNPFRLEGQKTIMFRVLEALGWEVPDWIVVPGGNLGNVSAFGKAFMELTELGLIAKPPRLAVINAAGANTFYQLYERFGLRWNGGRWDGKLVSQYYGGLDAEHVRAATIASAIEINRPVNLS